MSDLMAGDYFFDAIYEGPIAERSRDWSWPPEWNQAFVYFLGSYEELLYVGKASVVRTRWEAHRSRKPWWTEVQHAKLVRVTGRNHWVAQRAALDLEKSAIATLLPKYNIVGPPNLPARQGR